MLITENQYNDAYRKIITCKNNTCYNQVELDSMFESALYILNTINIINNETILTQDYLNRDIELFINIIDIKFSHNDMLIYSNRSVLKYLKEYMFENIKIFNELYLDNTKHRSIKTSGNGHGSALVLTYDEFRNIK